MISRKFQTSSTLASKISKRRKDTKLKESPNLRKNQNGDKKNATQTARDFFDNHYKQIYGPDWHSLRLALFSKPKFAALVNNFSATEEIIDELKSKGCLNIKHLIWEQVLDVGMTYTRSGEK